MRRLISIALVAGACVAAVVLTAASGEGAKGKTYKIEFDNAFGLVEGGDFRVGGVKAGQTTEFGVSSGRPHRAVVTARITQAGLDDFRRDASCQIKPQSLIGEYFVDCQPGNSAEKLRDGGVIPVRQTSSTIPFDLVNNIMRRPYRERLRLIIAELGTALAGRPKDLAQALRRAHPGLRETSRVLRILGDQNETIENFIRDSDTIVRELERNKVDVVRFIREAGDAAEISATRREDLRRTFRRLPGFLDELRPTMARLGELADEQVPLLADAERAAPSLDLFLRRLGPFAEASRPAIRTLGEASVAGTRAFREGANEIDELRAAAREARPTFRPLRQVLQSLDTRRRAVENDQFGRDRVGAPPRPDPTAPRGGVTGFTGFESLWNYFYWQGLATNGFDGVSHILRVGVNLQPETCSQYKPQLTPEEIRGEFKQCLQWLGPNQPGTAGQPDFTVGSRAAQLQARAGRPARRAGERRAPGQPDAGPLPGQRDLSKPQYALPPSLQGLLDQLPRAGQGGSPGGNVLENALGGARRAPNGSAPRSDADSMDSQVLDYLLGP